MKKLILTLILLMMLALGWAISTRVNDSTVRVIAIDPGHGGKDPGCSAYHGAQSEKDVALSIALKLGAMIEKKSPEIKVIYTRKTDVFVPLWERADIANKAKADLFISIHCNANNSPLPQGTESYVMGLHKGEGNLLVSKRENNAILLEEDYENNESYAGFDPNSDEAHIILSLYQNAYRNQSLAYADAFQRHIAKEKTVKNRGVKEAGFLVLWKTAMPSVLLETGFLTNSNDDNFLQSELGKTKMAEAMYNAILEYKIKFERAD